MTAPPRILLLEDDPAIARTVAFALQREGYLVAHHLWLDHARKALEQPPLPAAAILDVGLPDGSGLDLCRWLRASGDAQCARLPVLMLTARHEEIDRVLGLELGADDYVTKPFSPRELVARVRALLRRARAGALAAPAAALSVAGFEVDDVGQRVTYAGQRLDLTRLEYALLRALLAAPGRILSRDALLQAAWGSQAQAGDRTVDTHVKTLRAKLRRACPGAEPIATHRGMGYELVRTDG